MSLAQLRREMERIRSELRPNDGNLIEGWLRFTGNDGETRHRGCFAPHYEASPFEGITEEALRNHWHGLERRGFQITALIYADQNLVDIYRTRESDE